MGTTGVENHAGFQLLGPENQSQHRKVSMPPSAKAKVSSTLNTDMSMDVEDMQEYSSNGRSEPPSHAGTARDTLKKSVELPSSSKEKTDCILKYILKYPRVPRYTSSVDIWKGLANDRHQAQGRFSRNEHQIYPSPFCFLTASVVWGGGFVLFSFGGEVDYIHGWQASHVRATF